MAGIQRPVSMTEFRRNFDDCIRAVELDHEVIELVDRRSGDRVAVIVHPDDFDGLAHAMEVRRG